MQLMGKKPLVHFWDWKQRFMVEYKKADTQVSFQRKCYERQGTNELK